MFGLTPRLVMILGAALAASLLFGTALWRAHDAGRAAERGRAAQETINAIRKASEARERARVLESDPGRVPDDKWRRD